MFALHVLCCGKKKEYTPQKSIIFHKFHNEREVCDIQSLQAWHVEFGCGASERKDVGMKIDTDMWGCKDSWELILRQQCFSLISLMSGQIFHRAAVCHRQAGYLGVIQLGKSGTGVREQEVAAQDGHLVPKLHVLQRAVRDRPLLQVDDPAVHQERRVDQLRDFCQVALAVRQKEKNIFLKITSFFSAAFKRSTPEAWQLESFLTEAFSLSSCKSQKLFADSRTGVLVTMESIKTKGLWVSFHPSSKREKHLFSQWNCNIQLAEPCFSFD